MKILVLPGDGIGPEIVEAGLSVLNAVNGASKLASPSSRTADLGGAMGTKAFGEHVAGLVS